MKRKIIVLLIGLAACCMFGFVGCAEQEQQQPAGHTHDLQYIEAIDPTCTEEGNRAYWYCSGCGKYYADGSAINELNYGSWTIAALGHNFADWQTVTAATCTENGEQQRFCIDCGAKETGIIAASGHDYTQSIVPPTCSAQGYTLHTCQNCGDTYSDNFTDMTAHTYGEWQQISNPTCTAEGEKQRFCLNCGHRDTAPVDKLAHNYGEWQTIDAATCTEKGKEQHVCTACGAREERDISVLGHAYADQVIQPTCTEQGYTIHTCKRENCGYTEKDTYTDALGHSYVETVVSPTCTQEGYTLHECQRENCGDSFKDSYVDSLGHHMAEQVIDPTCTESGYTRHYCQRENCGYSYTDTYTDALDHDIKDTVVPPTCTERGYTLHECQREGCETSYKDTYINATGHSWTAWETTKDATCTEDGEQQRICSTCNIIETDVIEAIGHDYNSNNSCIYCRETLDYTLNLEYTLQEDGTYCVTGRGYADLSKGLIIPQYHNAKLVTWIYYSAFAGCSNLTTVTLPSSIKGYNYNAFENCPISSLYYLGNLSKWIASGNGYILEDNPEASIYINGELLQEVAKGRLILPDNITNISSYSLYNCSGLTEIVIPNSVTIIGSFAFGGCTGLTHITIPNSVTTIYSGAFSGCSSLKSISLPFVGRDNNYYYGQLASLEENVFAYIFGDTYYDSSTAVSVPISYTTTFTYYIPTSLNSVTITNCDVIPEKAFYDCITLTSINLPNSITSIGNSAFNGCISLTEITIPNSVTSIGNSAFNGCISLTEITIPNNVTSVGYGVFSDCSGLTSIIIPNSITNIGESVFYRCISLTEINIPNSITSIGNSAFFGCSGLTSVNITDLSAWCKISFHNSSANPLYHAHNLYLNGELVIDLVFPDEVMSIESYAFYGCSSLASIEIPNSVTSIGEYAFCGCSSLASIKIPNSVTSIGNSAFYNCNSLTSIEIPNSVTSIGDSAFYGCTKLASVTFSKDSRLTSIGKSAFCNCDSLTSIEIPNNVTSIGDSAFAGCSKLTNTILGENVTYIGQKAFQNCENLISVTFITSENWYVVVQENIVTSSGTPVSSEDLSDPAKAAELLTQTYCDKCWKRAE